METLAKRLHDRIASEGPLRFDAWMEAVLYDPQGGYYMVDRKRTGAGSDADFATSVTLHPFLAQCVGREIASAFERQGSPPSFAVWEFGGGEGDLARDALAFLDENHPELAKILTWFHVEKSPTHREKQTGDDRLHWTTDMPSGSGFVIGHEFLDALAARWFQFTEDAGWQEAWIASSNGGFQPEWRDGTPRLTAPQTFAGLQHVQVDAAQAWWAALSGFDGDVLLVDYGAAGHAWWGRRGHPFRTYGHQEHGPDPWVEPGNWDITYDVDPKVVALDAHAAGFQVDLQTSQEEFLLDHGILEALNAMPRVTQEDASAYLRLRQLLLPSGFGRRFFVMRFRRVL